MSKTNQLFASQPSKEKKDDEINMNAFFNFLMDDDRKIERPISAPPPGLSSNDTFYTPNNEGIDERLYDYKYYVYYYSQKPLDPRLPKPLLHWDKNMTEGYYKAYVNALLEKQKQVQKPKMHDLAAEFEQKAKINEVNENSSEDNNYHDLLDDEIPDLDDSGNNQSNNNPSTNVKNSPENSGNFAYIAKPQPQASSNYNQNKSQFPNTYNPFGFSQPSGNQFYNPNQNNNQRMGGPGQMAQSNQGNYFMRGNNQIGGMNPMNSMGGGQLPQMGGMVPMGQMGMNSMNSMNQMNYPMNNFNANPNFVTPFQQNMANQMGMRPQPFANPQMNPMFMNPYPNQGYPNMMQTNQVFMNNNMMNQKPGFMFQGGMGNQIMAPKMGFIEMCQDQNGSRQIQQQFEHGTDQEKENIYNAIQDKIQMLMKDVFGNYVIQKMFEKGDFKIKKQIHEKIKPDIIELSLHMYGCRVVQKSLEVFRDNYAFQNDIITELKSNVMRLIQDQNGNHVIQKCFETVPAAKLEFIVDEVIANIDNLAFHAFGCRVIQKILEYSNPQKISPIMRKLMDNIIRLSECQFGNYIIQHIIEKGPPVEKDKVLSTIKQGFVDLSVNKFASNVTEKAVMFCNEDYRKEILIILFKTSTNHEMGILRMMKNAYGNYVVQRLYEYCDEDSRNKIYMKINQPEILSELRKNNYGKHVLSFIEKNQAEKQH